MKYQDYSNAKLILMAFKYADMHKCPMYITVNKEGWFGFSMKVPWGMTAEATIQPTNRDAGQGHPHYHTDVGESARKGCAKCRQMLVGEVEGWTCEE